MHSIIQTIIIASAAVHLGTKTNVPDTFVQLPLSRPVAVIQAAPLPLVDEKPLYVPPAPAPVVAAANTPNDYPVGQCTWGAKHYRPDIPNDLGDAQFWFNELKARGWSVGYVPKAGAVGQEIIGNHVVYVESVSGAYIHLAEYNYDYNGSFRERDALASAFEYIY